MRRCACCMLLTRWLIPDLLKRALGQSLCVCLHIAKGNTLARPEVWLAVLCSLEHAREAGRQKKHRERCSFVLREWPLPLPLVHVLLLLRSLRGSGEG